MFIQALQDRRLCSRSLSASFYEALEIAKIAQPADKKTQTLFDITQRTLAIVESDGELKALKGNEPAYHNRQHFADACLALGFFLKELDQFSKYQKLLLMLTMLVHDFGHKGIANLTITENQERVTTELLLSSPLIDLDISELNLVTQLILGTAPHGLSSTNSLYLNNRNYLPYFMQALVNDADIATSFIDLLTPTLTRLILIESGNPHPTKHEITSEISLFKKNFHITTEIAKKFLF